jgi:glutamine cyclotransferase
MCTKDIYTLPLLIIGQIKGERSERRGWGWCKGAKQLIMSETHNTIRFWSEQE